MRRTEYDASQAAKRLKVPAAAFRWARHISLILAPGVSSSRLGFVHDNGQQVFTTWGGTTIWCCSIARPRRVSTSVVWHGCE